MKSRILETAFAGFLSVAVVAPLVHAAPPAPAPAANDALVMASVNEETVTAGQILKLFKDRHSGHAGFLGGPVEARAFLNMVIDERLLTQEAFNLGLDEEPEVQTEMKEFIDRKAADLLVRKEIIEKAKPTAEKIDDAWKKLNVVLQARQIALATRQEAEEVRAAILRGADASELARKCSGAKSSRNGGNIMVSWGQFPPEWEAAVMPLQPGELAPVIETRDGFEVVLVQNRVETPLPEFKTVSEQITNTLGRRNTDVRETEFSAYLWDKYGASSVEGLDFSPLALLRAATENPKLVIATWQNGGQLILSDAFEAGELRQIVSLPPRRASHEVKNRIRTTVNSPLVILEGRARKLEEEPELATKIEEYREYLMKNMLFRDHIFAGLTASDDKLLAYYEAHKSEFEEPMQYHVAQILLSTEKEANEVRSKLAGGAEFTAIVEKYSKDPVSAASGGDLGYVTADKVPQAFQEVLTLKAGGVTKPILNTTGAWHLIKLLDIKPKRIPEFTEIKDTVQKAATEAGKRAAKTNWVSKLRGASKITIDEAAITQFVDDHKDDGSAPPQHALQ